MCHSSDFFCNHLKTQKPFSAWSCTKTCHGQDVAHGLWFANAPYTSLGRIICSSHLVCPSCGVSAINIRTCRLHLPPPSNCPQGCGETWCDWISQPNHSSFSLPLPLHCIQVLSGLSEFSSFLGASCLQGAYTVVCSRRRPPETSTACWAVCLILIISMRMSICFSYSDLSHFIQYQLHQ